MRPTWPSAPPSATLLSCQHRYFFNKEGDFNNLTAAAYHKKTHLLVTGFASGIFHLHELPEFNLIHSLRWAPLLCRPWFPVLASLTGRWQSGRGRVCPPLPLGLESAVATRTASRDTGPHRHPGQVAGDRRGLRRCCPRPRLRHTVSCPGPRPHAWGRHFYFFILFILFYFYFIF